MLLAMGAVDHWWFERPMLAHLRHAIPGLEDLLPRSRARLPHLRPMTWTERWSTIVEYWLTGFGGPALFSRRGAALHLPRRRPERRAPHSQPQRRQAARQLRPARPLCRRVPLAPQPRHRFERQHLHGRGGIRKARAEVRHVGLTRGRAGMPHRRISTMQRGVGSPEERNAIARRRLIGRSRAARTNP